MAGGSSVEIPFSITPSRTANSAPLNVTVNSDYIIEELVCSHEFPLGVVTVKEAKSPVLRTFSLKWNKATDGSTADNTPHSITHNQNFDGGNIDFKGLAIDHNADCMEVYFELHDAYPYNEHTVVLRGDHGVERVLGIYEDQQGRASKYVCFIDLSNWTGTVSVYEGSVETVAEVAGLGAAIAVYSMVLPANATTDFSEIENENNKVLQDCFTATGAKIDCNSNVPGTVIFKRYTDGSVDREVK